MVVGSNAGRLIFAIVKGLLEVLQVAPPMEVTKVYVPGPAFVRSMLLATIWPAASCQYHSVPLVTSMFLIDPLLRPQVAF